MDKKSYSDTEIFSGLKENNSEIIKFLYRQAFNTIRHYVENNSGSMADAEDIFQDALVIVYYKIIKGELMLTCALKTYMFSVCRNLWLQRVSLLKRCAGQEAMDNNRAEETIMLDAEFIEMEKLNLLQKYLLAMDKECQRLLRLFLQRMPMKEMTRILGFSSPEYTKFRKYQCKNRLREKILGDPYFKLLLAYE